MIPGVGQGEEFPLKSHQQQIVGPRFLKSCWHSERDFQFASRDFCESLNKPEETSEASAFAGVTHFLKAVSLHMSLAAKLGGAGLSSPRGLWMVRG